MRFPPRLLLPRDLCPLGLPLLTAVFSTSPDVRAAGGAATDSYEDIRAGAFDVHGLADVYLQTGLPHELGSAHLRAFDPSVGAPAVGLLRVTLAHKPDRFGFRLDAGIGALPEAYLRLDPAALSHPVVSRSLSYLEQGFVTAILPVGRGLWLDVGKFETPVGLEDNEALENWNYSRSLLYLLAEPSFHSGLRATEALTSTVAVSIYWVNGWDANLLGGNGMRAAAAAVSFRPISGLEVVLDTMEGLERAPTQPTDPALSFRTEMDAYVRYQAGRRLSLASTADYGRDAARGGVSWWGVAAYVRLEVLEWLAGALRAEHYDDSSGFTSGTGQRLAEVTATIEARHSVESTTWIGRLEYRRDQSDEASFRSGSQASTHQDTLGLSLVAAF